MVQLVGLLLLAVGSGLLAVWLGLVVAGAGLLVFGVALEVGERAALTRSEVGDTTSPPVEVPRTRPAALVEPGRR